MTQTEFRKILSETKNTKWFNSVEINLRYTHLNLSFDFKGFGHIHRFVSQQIKGWEKLSENLPNELLASKKHFEFIENQLISFINSYGSQENESNLDSHFRNPKNQIQSHTGIHFTYDCPETEFLIDVYKNHTQSFIGAYTYLTGNLNQNIAVKDNFNGYLLAYEFTLKDSTLITERRNKEKSSLSKLRNDFQNSLPKLDSELVEHLKNSTEKYEEFGTSLDEFKEDKEKTYSDWFINTKGEFEEFSNKSDERLKELEDTYKEKLKLEEPALYWSKRGEKLKKQGWIALGVLVGLVLIVVFSLGKLLWTTPEQIYESFFNGDKSAAIRWSIIYITFISFMAFAIRAVTKVMFSSFHLARDCEERHTLTYFYLSLLKDSKVEKEEKQLIMQALFSRAETGLLKDDSSPTMPNDIIGKFMSK
ncbi:MULTISPECIES: DUF6161 domain-containing protein [Flavobacteriaceae]|uniref:DUF6161 domain-containing protein n=1 Tax=Bizionia paragorgiae TaxID=283786 RepID=A0A1H4B7S5_BIZPA|nr:DUF6161 domain-containing protein [Bizionia paragorgiae]SEA44146.1 hypothetical protein SAMN04487990_11378 [Bizionia paragorgiae]